MTIISDASHRMKSKIGDVITINCFCGREIFCYEKAKGWIECTCGRKYMIFVQTRALMKDRS